MTKKKAKPKRKVSKKKSKTKSKSKSKSKANLNLNQSLRKVQKLKHSRSNRKRILLDLRSNSKQRLDV